MFICETTLTGCPRSRPRVSLSIYLSAYLSISPSQHGASRRAASHALRLWKWARPPSKSGSAAWSRSERATPTCRHPSWKAPASSSTYSRASSSPGCAHVVLGIYNRHLKSTATALDPGGAAPNAGLAIGVGIGEQITWVCRAELRYISRPPLNYQPVPPPHWVVQDDGKFLDLAVLQLVAPNGSALQTPAQVLALHGKNACALSLGVPPSMPQSVPLSDGAELVLLGYGQSLSGEGAERTSTTMRGHYAGCYSSKGQVPGSKQSGDWLKVDVTILSGHSGGPVVNRVGEVVGWAVMSDRTARPLGQLRPIASLVPALTSVLQQHTPASVTRDWTGGLRSALQGAIPPGKFELGGEELKRCRDAAARAALSATDAASSATAAATSETAAASSETAAATSATAAVTSETAAASSETAAGTSATAAATSAAAAASSETAVRGAAASVAATAHTAAVSAVASAAVHGSSRPGCTASRC